MSDWKVRVRGLCSATNFFRFLAVERISLLIRRIARQESQTTTENARVSDKFGMREKYDVHDELKVALFVALSDNFCNDKKNVYRGIVVGRLKQAFVHKIPVDQEKRRSKTS